MGVSRQDDIGWLRPVTLELVLANLDEQHAPIDKRGHQLFLHLRQEIEPIETANKHPELGGATSALPHCLCMVNARSDDADTRRGTCLLYTSPSPRDS